MLKQLRLDVLAMAEHSGHVGPALSCLELIAALYSGVLRITPETATAPDRDRFILSKGHGCMALYAVLAATGFFSRQALEGYCRSDACLAEHPMPGKMPGVELATGSLGHGLAYGAGLAKAFKMLKQPPRVFVLLGDGECDEGSVWEAVAAARANGLDNLTAIVDANGLQACGRCRDISPGFDLQGAFAGFGWDVQVLKDFTLSELRSAFAAPANVGIPRVFVCSTVKGAGIDFMEDDLEWHYRPVRGEDKRLAIKSLEDA